MGKLLQTSRHETTSQRNGRVGKTQNQGDLLETVEENQNEISNAPVAKAGALEGKGTSQ
jgi:hypothetical protein